MTKNVMSGAGYTPRVILAVFLLSLGLQIAGCDDGHDVLGEALNGAENTIPAAVLSEPVAGAPVLVGTFFDLSALGYRAETEYFISGEASSYVNQNELLSDGKWSVQADTQAPYTTRIVVIRPDEPAAFNGTVVVEWLNVSAGFDSGPDWGMLHTELIRQGYAWVGVSAQSAGVEALKDGTAAAIIPGVEHSDRYASLNHPGDSFSYDIYSQVAQVLRTPGEVNPFAGLEVRHLIAAGESQSAGRLLTYINALAPIHNRFDAYFVHSRTAGSAGLQGDLFNPVIATPAEVQVRDDLEVPTMMVQTETDLFILGSYPSNQEDSEWFRLWEIAGTAHADLYTFLQNRFDVGTNPGIAAVVEELSPVPGIIECTVAVNSGPQHFVAKAALRALRVWMVEGIAPPSAARLTVVDEPPRFARDELGNVLGGVRTPYVDAPIAVLEGGGQPQPNLEELDELSVERVDFCFLSGRTQLFDAATLGSLYVDNAAYVEAVNVAADAAVANQFLLPEDAQLIKDYAASTDIFSP